MSGKFEKRKLTIEDDFHLPGDGHRLVGVGRLASEFESQVLPLETPIDHPVEDDGAALPAAAQAGQTGLGGVAAGRGVGVAAAGELDDLVGGVVENPALPPGDLGGRGA